MKNEWFSKKKEKREADNKRMNKEREYLIN